MTAAPYSDQWRAHTRARMLRHGVSVEAIARRIGLDLEAVRAALLEAGEVSLEVAGPVDELLEALAEGRELASTARAWAPVDRPGRFGPVMGLDGQPIDLTALTGCRVIVDDPEALEAVQRREP